MTDPKEAAQDEAQQVKPWASLVPITPRTVALQSDSKIQPSAEVVELVQGMCRMLEVPVTGINILGGKPYVNIDGYLWKANRDGLKSIVVKVHQEATREDPTAKMTATVVMESWEHIPGFMGGQERRFVRVFQATAWHSAQVEGMSTMKAPELVNMKCETKAVRRALRRATGIGVGFTSEDEAEVDEARRQVVDLKRAARDAQVGFWGRAAELYPAKAGAKLAVDKMAVHRALGVPEKDGALRQHVDQTMKDTGQTEDGVWDDLLAKLEAIRLGVEEAPAQAVEGEVVEPRDANGAPPYEAPATPEETADRLADKGQPQQERMGD